MCYSLALKIILLWEWTKIHTFYNGLSTLVPVHPDVYILFIKVHLWRWKGDVKTGEWGREKEGKTIKT